VTAAVQSGVETLGPLDEDRCRVSGFVR